MLKTLSIIGEKLRNKNIIWGVGGSLLLSFYDLINKPNDIDILVDEADAEKFVEILFSIGEQKEARRSSPFQTVHFSKFRINNVDIDVMGGFAIEHEEGIYKLALTRESIVDYKNLSGVEIPLCSLEDWYILYWLIPNKQDKALMIEYYLKTNGVSHPLVLHQALMQPLPTDVKNRVKSLIETTS